MRLATGLLGTIAFMGDVVVQMNGVPFRFGGEQHTGWLPAGAAAPHPTPVHDVLLDLSISRDGSGYNFEWRSRETAHWGDTWHQSLEEAKQQAYAQFGINPDAWQRSSK
jgi:hypothetical protein